MIGARVAGTCRRMRGMEIIDEIGRSVTVPDRPSRIVSLVPSATETLFRLGAGPRIAGVTRYCNRPPRAARLPKIGGVLDIDFSAVTALRPDLVVASVHENRKEDVDAISGSSIPVFVTAPSSVAGALRTMKNLARIANAPRRAWEFIGDLESRIRGIPPPERTLDVLLVVWPDPVTGPGSGTFTADMLRMAGGRAVTEDLPGSWPVADRRFLEETPIDAVVLTTEPFAFGQSDVDAWRAMGLRFRGRPVVLLADGETANRPGPGFVRGILMLRRLLSGAVRGT